MLCDNLEDRDSVDGWLAGVGREAQERRVYVYVWLIEVVVQQKPTQYCKAIILQIKIK